MNVHDYGAAGDGITDDAAAIQSCLDEGGEVYFPPGTYRIGTRLGFPPTLRLLMGEPRRSIIIGGTAQLLSGGLFGTLTIDGLDFAGAGCVQAVNLSGPSGALMVRDCSFWGASADGVGATCGLRLSTLDDVTVEGCFFTGNGLALPGRSFDLYLESCRHVVLRDNRVRNSATTCSIFVLNGNDSLIEGNDVDQNNTYGGGGNNGYGICVYSSAALGENHVVRANNVRNCAGSGVYLLGCRHSQVSGNTVLRAAIQQRYESSLCVGSIAMGGCDDCTAEGNFLSGSNMNGIDTTGNRNVLRGNVIGGTKEYPILVRDGSRGCAAVRNVMVGNANHPHLAGTVADGNVESLGNRTA